MRRSVVIYRHQSPVFRVYAALARLSRDRWLLPSEVRRAGMALSRCCSGKPSTTLDAVVRRMPEIECVGMLRGLPPVRVGSAGYRGVMEAAESKTRFKRGASRELALLKAVLDTKGAA